MRSHKTNPTTAQPNCRTMPALVLTEIEAANHLSVSTRHLQRLRVDGGGPLFVRLGERRIGYRATDLDAWLASRLVASTSASTGSRGAA